MRRSKILALGRLILGAAMGLWLMAPVGAEVVDLSCIALPNQGRDIYMSIDTTASTATFWESSSSRNQGITNPATISDQQVTWHWSMPTGYQGGLVQDFTFDRNTGALGNIVMSNGRRSTNAWTCKRASRVF